MRFLVAVDIDDRDFVEPNSDNTYQLNKKNVRDMCDLIMVEQYGRPYVFTEVIDKETHRLLADLLATHLETGFILGSRSTHSTEWQDHFGPERLVSMRRQLETLELLDHVTADRVRLNWEAVIAS